jgi:hypothetical protein
MVSAKTFFNFFWSRDPGIPGHSWNSSRATSPASGHHSCASVVLVLLIRLSVEGVYKVCLLELRSDPWGPGSDLHITQERFGSISDPSINTHLHYPNDLDRPVNEVTTDKNSVVSH